MNTPAYLVRRFEHGLAKSLAMGVCALIFAASTGLASSPFDDDKPEPKPKPKKDDRSERIDRLTSKTFDISTPRHPLNKIDDLTKDRVIDRLRQLSGVHAGAESVSYKDSKKDVFPPEEECVWFCNPSVFVEYYYLNSNDKTSADFDGDTHSVSAGFDFTTIGDLLVGLIYSYSHADLESDSLRSGSDSDSHFISLYAAKSVTNWLSVGLSGGYGHTDTVVSVRRPFQETASDSDTWNVSPFFTLSYASDNFFASFTTTYLFAHSGGSDTGKVSFDLRAGYSLTEWLTIAGNAKFTQIVHGRQNSGQDDNWWTFGFKVTHHLTQNLDLYAGYDFEFNSDYEDHTVTAGLSYAF